MQQADLFWRLEKLSDVSVLGGLNELVGSGRRVLAALLAHLGEVEERRLHLAAGHGSLFAYCVSRLALSEDEAYRRIEVARLARRFPVLFPLLADGRVSLSVAALLKPHLSAHNAGELTQLVCGASVQRARELLAARFPRPDVPATIRKLPEPTLPREDPSPQAGLLPGLVEPSPVPSPVPQSVTECAPRPSETSKSRPAPTDAARKPAKPRPVEPLAEGRYKVQFTADAELKSKLELARDLMRHTLPGGELSAIVTRALDLLIEQLMKRRFGAAKRAPAKRTVHEPAAAPGGEPSSPASNISRATRREVLERDGLRCSFRSADGVQCDARGWLEDDHIHPRARGGDSVAGNVRFLCRAHNLWAAERAYGRAHVANAIQRSRAERARVANGGASEEPGGARTTQRFTSSGKTGSPGLTRKQQGGMMT
jgi:5-methylcytosine-specific restriction endonuclease McrA